MLSDYLIIVSTEISSLENDYFEGDIIKDSFTLALLFIGYSMTYKFAMSR